MEPGIPLPIFSGQSFRNIIQSRAAQQPRPGLIILVIIIKSNDYLITSLTFKKAFLSGAQRLYFLKIILFTYLWLYWGLRFCAGFSLQELNFLKSTGSGALGLQELQLPGSRAQRAEQLWPAGLAVSQLVACSLVRD